MMTSQRSYELNEKGKRNQINKINRENLKKMFNKYKYF